MSVYLWKQKHFLSIFILHIKKTQETLIQSGFFFYAAMMIIKLWTV